MTVLTLETARRVVPVAPGPVRRRRSLAASVLLLALGVDVGAVLALGVARFGTDVAAPGGLALWGGRVTGLLAEVLVLGMVLLAARLPALERAVGQDTLLRWHRWLGPTVLVVIVAHPLLLAAGYAGAAGWWPSLVGLGSTTLDAVVGTGLFVIAAGTSVGLVRRRLPYESWHLLHLLTYAAVVLAFLHQLTAGSTVLQGTVVRTWWLMQVIAVLGLAAVHRVIVPLWVSARHGLRVVEVVRETDDVVSVVVRGRDLNLLGARGGQFLVWRFLDRSHWWRAHPFSLSAAPGGGLLRLTARQVGDGTRDLQHLRPGTRLLVEGPYGVMTGDARHGDRVLLIGAGLGIAPLRALLEDLPTAVDVVVLHRASHAGDAVLHAELVGLAAHRPATRVELVTGGRGAAGDPDRPLGARSLRRLVPDIADRDVYVCGPAGLTDELRATVRSLGLPGDRVHAESFAF